MATSIHAHNICSLEHSLRTSCKPATGYASTTRKAYIKHGVCKDYAQVSRPMHTFI